MKKSIVLRFWKGFLAGGLASIAVLLQAGFSVTDMDSLKKLGFAIIGAFISGGFLATWKYLSWEE